MKLGLVSVHCVASAPWTLQSEPVRLPGRPGTASAVQSSAPASLRSLHRPVTCGDACGAARSGGIYGCVPAGSLGQTGQQAPSTLTGAGQSAGWQASTKQVICPSWRETAPAGQFPTTPSITPLPARVPAGARV